MDSICFLVRTSLEGPVLHNIFDRISFVGGQYIWLRFRTGDPDSFLKIYIVNSLVLCNINNILFHDIETNITPCFELVQNAELLYRAASFFTLLLFLYGGRYLPMSV
jgi:peroxin-2